MKLFLSILAILLILVAVVVTVGVGSLPDVGGEITVGLVALILVLLGLGAVTNAVARAQR